MSKGIFIICILCLNYSISHGQLMLNGDFSNNVGNGNFECENINAGSKFLIKPFQNWYATHGTPYFSATDPDAIYLEDIGRRGEGIVGSYPFKKGVTYTIHLGVSSVTNPGNILMVAGNGPWPYDGNCYNYCNSGDNESHGKTPITFSPSANQEWVLNPLGGTGLSTINVGDNVFTFTPSKRDQDWITLYPFGQQGECPFTSIIVDYIWINKQCKGDKYIDIFQDNPNWFNSEPYWTFDYNNIFVGSASLIYTNGRSGHLQASQSITFTPNFLADIGTYGMYFLANINPAACDYFPDNLDNGVSKNTAANVTPDQERLKNTELLIQELHSETNISTQAIKIHPNPTTGSFTIQLPIAEDCEVRITNIMGATVYQSSMKGEQKKQIQLDGGLPAGNYTLQLRGKTINHIEKLVLTK